MKPPLFIIGNPRSGTTLLRLMLHNHINIIIPPECGFAVWWYDKYKNWNKDYIKKNKILDSFMKDFKSSKKIETWELDYYKLKKFIIFNKVETYSELVSAIYEFYGKSLGKDFSIWGDKNNFHLKYISILKKLFPEAYFIHIIRDGRDIACSYKELAKKRFMSKYAPNLPVDIQKIANEWVQNISNIRNSFSCFCWEKVYELKYEDLVRNTEIELRKICKFLKEPFDDNMLNYYKKNKIEVQEPKEFLQWKSKTLEKPTTSRICRYKKRLSSIEINEFNKIAKKILIRYEY